MSNKEKKNLKYDKTNRILICFICCYDLFLLGSLGIRARWIFLILFIVSSFLFLTMNNKKTIIMEGYKIRWLVSTAFISFFVLLPNSRKETDVVNFFLFMLIITICYILTKANNSDVVRVFAMMRIVAIIVAVYISFSRIFSNLYFAFILPHLKYTLGESMQTSFSYGYGPAIGNSYTYGDYLIMFGVAELVSSDISSSKSSLSTKVLILICLLGILMEGRKGELIAAILSIMLIYMLTRNNCKIIISKKGIMIKVMIISIIGVLIPILLKMGFLRRLVIMVSRLSEYRSGLNSDFSTGRIDLWKQAIRLFSKKPIFGIGWGRFANYSTGRYVKEITDQAKYVHNTLLQLLCETGIIGTFSIIAPIISTFFQTYKHLNIVKKKNLIKSDYSKNTIFSINLMLFYFILSFIDPIFYNHFFWCAYAIILIINAKAPNVYNSKELYVSKFKSE